MEFINTIDMGILDFININMHNAFFDSIMPYISMIGNGGVVWILIAILLIFLPKYRKSGLAMGIALLLCLLIGNITLKPLVARIRPCDVNSAVILLIPRPTDFSFPSGHTLSSFASAVTLMIFNKKQGAIAMVLACLIAFSRLYLYVHYPTDILAGIVMGICIAFASASLIKFINKKRKI